MKNSTFLSICDKASELLIFNNMYYYQKCNEVLHYCF